MSAAAPIPPRKKSLRPGQYDWLICKKCGAKHGWKVDQCLQCGGKDLKQTATAK